MESFPGVEGAAINCVCSKRKPLCSVDVSLITYNKYMLQREEGGVRITHIQYPRFAESVGPRTDPSIRAITIVALKFIQFETGDHRQPQRHRRASPRRPPRRRDRPSL